MKKTTLFLCAILLFSGLDAQVQRKWQGSQELKVWDYATPNWLNPGSPLPIPTTFADGATALFDDSILREGDTLKISGTINAASVTVNASKPYAIRRTADTDELTGTGTLVKEGTGILSLDFKNSLVGGTILKSGTLVQERQNSPNVYGAKLVIEGGKVNMGFAGNSSSAYTFSTIPVVIPAGKTAQIELPRYSTFVSPVSGEGTLELLSTGERVHMGYQSLPAGVTSAMPNFSAFSGALKITKLTSTFTPGFWGLVLSTSKTYDYEVGTGVDSTLHNKKVILGSGTTLATHSGTRGFMIGELQSEDETTVLCGYRSASTTPRLYFLVGSLNTDVVYPGRIAQAPGISSNYNHVCFIKIGTGTYTFTHPNNNILGGLIVREGKLLVNDPVLPGNYLGGVGNWTLVEANGTLGGTGRIQGNVDVHGKLAPGSNGIGTLLIRDTLSVLPEGVGGTRAFNLSFHPGSVAEFEIQSAQAYDKVVSSGALRFYNDEANIVAKPKIQIKLVPGYSIKDGDQFEIISAKNLHLSSESYDIEYPDVAGVTWSVDVVESIEEPLSYKLIVKAAGNASGLKQVVEKNVTVYPNPVVGGDATFRSADAMIKSVEIVNLQGQVMMQQSVNAHEIRLNLHDLGTGMYYARIHTEKGTEVHKMMLK